MTTDDGLPSNNIEEVLQDHRGYLWLGTSGALVRYDGYDMKVFRHMEDDSTSLSDDWVFALHESADGTLWVGTLGGLNRYNAATETFESFRHVAGDSTSLSSDHVQSIHETADGTLWVGTRNGGLNRYDAATETFESFRHVADDTTSLSNDLVFSIHETADGTLWAGTEVGLNRYDAATETFETFQHAADDPTSLSHDQVWSIHETADGTLWIGTYGGGLNRYNAAAKTFKSFRHMEDDPTSLSHDYVISIHESPDGTLWTGTEGGLNRYDAISETFEKFQYVADDPSSLSDNQVLSIYETTDGTFWVGTQGGLNRYDTATETFEIFRHAAGDPTSLSNDFVISIHESSDETLWVGTNGGLNRYDTSTKTFETFRYVEDDPTSLSNDRVWAIHETVDDMFWVGTEGGGLNRYDAATGTFETFRHVAGDSTSLSHDYVLSIHETGDGTLWVGTAGGLNRYDAATETFETFRPVAGDSASLSNDLVIAINGTAAGTLWVGTYDGLNRYDVATGTFETFRHVAGDSTSLSNDLVLSIHETGDGTLWVGTEGGLNRYDVATGTFETFRHVANDPTSLSSDRVSSIVEDVAGQLWLGLHTDGRLARFNPRTRRARYFGKRYGLPSGAFYPGGLQSRDGTLYWGNTAGLISLRLDDLPPEDEPPILHLSELWLFDERLTPGPDSPLENALWQTEALRLSHSQNDLTFGFVGLHYANPEENRYQYRLLGYDSEWRSETDQRRATYTSLPPGDYTFEVKAANSDGIWTEEPVRLGVEILPPWWRTVWAYLVYGVWLVAGILAFDRFWHKRLIAKERLRAEREKARAIEATNNELQRVLKHLTETQDQLIHTEKMASLGQLTAGIAHEIKNPLNFVNNFSALSGGMIDELKTWIEEKGGMEEPEVRELVETLKMNAAMINEHGQRADGIIRSMLEHSRTGRGERRPVDINKLVDEYVNLAYHGIKAREEGFTVELDREYDEAIGEVEIYPKEIGRVLINLLDNAFYTVNEKRLSLNGQYVPQVSVSTKIEGNHVEVHIEDNGKGISKEIHEKIFEPFFTTKPTGSGSGLGLSLSHDIIVNGHGGALRVESTAGNGAGFIIRLPA